MEGIKCNILTENQAILLCDLKIGQHHLNLNNMDKVFQILTEGKKKVEKLNDVHPFVYSTLHKLFSVYYKTRNEYDEFYNHSLQYLAYTPETVYFLKELNYFIQIDF